MSKENNAEIRELALELMTDLKQVNKIGWTSHGVLNRVIFYEFRKEFVLKIIKF